MGKKECVHIAEAPFCVVLRRSERDVVARCGGPEDLFREVKDDLTHVILGRAFGCCDDD